MKAWQKAEIRKGIISNFESKRDNLIQEHNALAEAVDEGHLLMRDMIGAKIVELNAEIKKLKSNNTKEAHNE